MTAHIRQRARGRARRGWGITPTLCGAPSTVEDLGLPEGRALARSRRGKDADVCKRCQELSRTA